MSSSAHGGKRAGAGRPAVGKVSLTVRVVPETVARIRARAAIQPRVAGNKFGKCMTRGEVIDHALELLEVVT